MKNLTKWIGCTVVMISVSGCLPNVLNKYRRSGASHSSSSLQPTQPRPKTAGGKQATIFATDQQTFRFLIKEGDVWNAALSVLMRNYNLTIVDEKSGILTTEWDSFYLNNEVYRNKVSLRIHRPAWKVVDVSIHNNVEKLLDASQAAGAMGAVWLPAEDDANEIARIVQNMALVLNQAPPILPPGMKLARDIEDKGDSVQ